MHAVCMPLMLNPDRFAPGSDAMYVRMLFMDVASHSTAVAAMFCSHGANGVLMVSSVPHIMAVAIGVTMRLVSRK